MSIRAGTPNSNFHETSGGGDARSIGAASTVSVTDWVLILPITKSILEGDYRSSLAMCKVVLAERLLLSQLFKFKELVLTHNEFCRQILLVNARLVFHLY